MENKKLVDSDIILNWITERIKNKQPIGPGEYLDAAVKLNMLLADEQENLYNYWQIVSELKVKAMEAGDTAAKANIKINASEENKQYLIQKARIDRIVEMIRLSKIQSRMSLDEMKGY